MDCFYVNNLADLALIGVIKTIIKLNTNLQILYYRKNEKLKKRIEGNVDQLDYKIKLGFGLHQGWAIEGSIGSRFKIDASYLSHNVNVSSKLEENTKNYGCNYYQLFQNY